MTNLIPQALERAFESRVSLPLKDTAQLLGMDAKTLRGHAMAGNIRFVSKGLGTAKLRREFTLLFLLPTHDLGSGRPAT
jgi:hypothetical protein